MSLVLGPDLVSVYLQQGGISETSTPGRNNSRVDPENSVLNQKTS